MLNFLAVLSRQYSKWSKCFVCFFRSCFLIFRFYLFILKGGKGRAKRGRETSIHQLPLARPTRGPGRQPRRAP